MSNLPEWNPADEGCLCAMSGMGRHANCPAHGLAAAHPATSSAE